MSGVPILVEATGLRVLVVGGGRVATRKTIAFATAGARVRVIARAATDELRRLAAEGTIGLELRDYASSDIGEAQVVIAATDERTINALVAVDAHRANRLANVVDAPEEGSFATMAVHRSGALVVGVSTGGIPGAAVRIRDAIAQRLDARYASAIDAMGEMRTVLLRNGRADDWRARAEHLLDERFCASVEDETLSARMDAWR